MQSAKICNVKLVSKFGSRDAKAWRLGARIISRTFLRNTLRLIQLSVLHHISTGYEPELARRLLQT